MLVAGFWLNNFINRQSNFRYSSNTARSGRRWQVISSLNADRSFSSRIQFGSTFRPKLSVTSAYCVLTTAYFPCFLLIQNPIFEIRNSSPFLPVSPSLSLLHRLCQVLQTLAGSLPLSLSVSLSPPRPLVPSPFRLSSFSPSPSHPVYKSPSTPVKYAPSSHFTGQAQYPETGN